MLTKLPLAALPIALAACAATPKPAIEIRTVEVPIEIAKACPAIPPERPEPLGALPDSLEPALAKVIAKLAEYSGNGKYADRAEAYFAACPPEAEQ